MTHTDLHGTCARDANMERGLTEKQHTKLVAIAKLAANPYNPKGIDVMFHSDARTSFKPLLDGGFMNFVVQDNGVWICLTDHGKAIVKILISSGQKN